MNYAVLLKLKEKSIYHKYLRENSNWYKILNRDPSKINEMIEEMKDRYHLRPKDKINNIVDGIDLVTKIFKVTSE